MTGVDWKVCAARVANLVSRSDLEPAAVAGLEAVSEEEATGLACSGGADSVLLVLALVGCLGRARSWHVLHFDHGVRGDASRADAGFVRSLAEGLGLPYSEGVGAGLHPPTEDVLRRARLDFLHATLRRLGSTSLALGHQAEDVIESMLIRLARGSGAAGLSSPRPVQAFSSGIRHYRPLLGWTRERVRRVLTEAGAPWREDASNLEDAHLRNRLRRTVLPAWGAAESRDLATGVLLARRRLEDEDRALDQWLEEMLPESSFSDDLIDLRPLRGRPVALWRRAIDRWARGRPDLSGISRSWVEMLVENALAGVDLRISAGKAGTVALTNDRLRFSPTARSPGEDWTGVSLATGSMLVLPSGTRVGARQVTLSPDLRERILSGENDPDGMAWLAWTDDSIPVFTVRPPCEGDRYRPLGAPGTIKLSDQFINRKICVERRRFLPVFCLPEGEIVWCPGLPPADRLRINEQTFRAVQLTYCWSTATFRL
ncbi:MAG: tRNA lysidine(34) synthetase TilS [Opitutaceae bacterium]